MKPTTSAQLPGKATSLWLDTTPTTSYADLPGGLDVDIAIVGGGIVGLTVASKLSEAGKSLVVIEARRVLEGVTGFTTAKITSLHTLIYGRLIRVLGEDMARAYGEANQSAIRHIREVVRSEGIDCDFTPSDAFTYAETPEEAEKVHAEADAASRLGLPASFVSDPGLPFSSHGAIRFEDQAFFHPRKYLLALSEKIVSSGNRIFEMTRVRSVADGEPCEVETDAGCVRAKQVVIATHFPLGDIPFYSTRLHPFRSYVLAARLDAPAPPGMYITTTSSRSLRRHPVGNGELVLIGGEGHKVGQCEDTEGCYMRLEKWARENLPVRSIEYRWSTQDNQTPDGAPYAGLNPGSEHVYVATGFGGWGMTNGTACGLLLADLILDRQNPYRELYDPRRTPIRALGKIVSEQADNVSHLIGDRLRSGEKEEPAPGEGAVVQTGQGKMAVYNDGAGNLRRLSPVCTHMGCHVTWNQAEKSWDCPCHGSRFAVDGTVIHGPAVRDLESK